MDVNWETEIYATELGDKIKDQNEEGAVDYKNFPYTIGLISDDGYVAAANSQGFFEDLDDVPISSCQGTPQNEATSRSSSSYPYQAPSKRGGKVNARAIVLCGGDKIT